MPLRPYLDSALVRIAELKVKLTRLRFLIKIILQFLEGGGNVDESALKIMLRSVAGIETKDALSPLKVESIIFRANPDKYIQQSYTRTIIITRGGEPRSYIFTPSV